MSVHLSEEDYRALIGDESSAPHRPDPGKANRGKTFEATVEKICNLYKSAGEAVITYRPTEWRVQRRGQRVVSAFPVRQSTLDFDGVWWGRAVAFDCKSTSRKRWFLSEMPQHQKDFLRAWVANGGLGFVLVQFKGVGVYLLPAAAVLNPDLVSFSPEELKHLRVPGEPPDFLVVVKRLLAGGVNDDH